VSKARPKRSLLRTLTWMLPGYAFKRWVLAIVFGLSTITLAIAVLFKLQPVRFILDGVEWLAQLAPSHLTGGILLGLGFASLLWGYNRMRYAMNRVIGEHSWVTKFMDDLYKNHKLSRGPKVVAIGGGTGLSTLLRGLKVYTSNITAVVTVGDDGGSSGILREEQKIIPPGDIRNCIAALASEEELMTELFQYRFEAGTGLGGHSFGNLFLTAMSTITGDMLKAIKASSNVLNICGRVLPSTLEPITLVAEMEDGSVVRGESQIPEANMRIKKLFCEPIGAKATDEALEAIRTADIIIMGPGSLYTSVIPNLLLPEICEAITFNTKAPKVYVANIVTQPGETDNMSLKDHVFAIESHANHAFKFDMIVASSVLPPALVALYEKHDAPPIEMDDGLLRERGTEVLLRPIVAPMSETNRNLRHNPHKVSRIIMLWFKRRQKKRQGRTLRSK
jgi:uncharacterized cofD-like protein